MPNIRITTRIAQDLAERVASAGGGAFAESNVSYPARIRIMSGPIPSQEEMELAYPTWDRFTGSPSEVLINFAIPSGYVIGNVAGGQVTWNLANLLAEKSGTASWWSWSGSERYNPIDRNINPDGPGDPYWQALIVGDISLVGGTGSMTLSDLEINAGESYEIGPASFPIPRFYTYV